MEAVWPALVRSSRSGLGRQPVYDAVVLTHNGEIEKQVYCFGLNESKELQMLTACPLLKQDAFAVMNPRGKTKNESIGLASRIRGAQLPNELK